MIKTIQHPDELLQVLPVVRALRPNVNEENIRSLIGGMMQRGYHLIYTEEDGVATAFCGYRYSEHLAWGRVIYVDDLGTLPNYRGKDTLPRCSSAYSRRRENKDWTACTWTPAAFRPATTRTDSI